MKFHPMTKIFIIVISIYFLCGCSLLHQEVPFVEKTQSDFTKEELLHLESLYGYVPPTGPTHWQKIWRRHEALWGLGDGTWPDLSRWPPEPQGMTRMPFGFRRGWETVWHFELK